MDMGLGLRASLGIFLMCESTQLTDKKACFFRYDTLWLTIATFFCRYLILVCENTSDQRYFANIKSVGCIRALVNLNHLDFTV